MTGDELRLLALNSINTINFESIATILEQDCIVLILLLFFFLSFVPNMSVRSWNVTTSDKPSIYWRV